MMNAEMKMNPYITLSVSPDTGDEGVRKAYMDKIKQYPPDQHPEKFRAIQASYENIKTARKRAKFFLFNKSPPFNTTLSCFPTLSQAFKNKRKPLKADDFLEILRDYV